MDSFYLIFRKRGITYTPKFIFDGCTDQRGHTLETWKSRCIDFWAREGFTYVREGTAAERRRPRFGVQP